MRYNGTTGAFIDVFASTAGSGMFQPQAPVFGPDGNFYVASGGTKQVLRFNGATGAFIDVFAAADVAVDDLVFASDGNLYVSGGGEFSGEDIDVFVTNAGGGNGGPNGMIFGPDGNLYVVSQGNISHEINRYDGSSGALIDIFVPC